MNKELKQRVREEFDEKFEGDYNFNCYYRKDIKSFIDSIIDKAMQMTEERIVGVIDKTTNKYYSTDKKTKEKTYSGGGQCRTCCKRKDCLGIDEIKSLITNKSDINK